MAGHSGEGVGGNRRGTDMAGSTGNGSGRQAGLIQLAILTEYRITGEALGASLEACGPYRVVVASDLALPRSAVSPTMSRSTH